MVERAKHYTKRFLMWLHYNTHKTENKAVFESFSGKTYSDNPRALSEKLHELSPETEIVWLFSNPEEKKKVVPSYVRCEKRDTKTMIKEYSTARIWVNNFTMQEFVYKGKRNTYVQTWHGDRPFKKVIYESQKLNFRPGEIREDKICDLCVAGSDLGEHVYRAAFRYSGKVMKTGTPRVDALMNYDETKNTAIKRTLGISEETKIVLYAPTFRDNKGLGVAQSMDVLDYSKLVDVLEKKTGSEWICLLRVHPSLKIKEITNNSGKIINASSYENMTDLLQVADMLITDYSSSAGDFIMRNKPVILYQYDLDEYESEDRELHFKMNESPFWSVRTQEELFDKIKSLDDQQTTENCKAICEFYGTTESGHASEDVCRFMIEKARL